MCLCWLGKQDWNRTLYFTLPPFHFTIAKYHEKIQIPVDIPYSPLPPKWQQTFMRKASHDCHSLQKQVDKLLENVTRTI